MAALSSSMNWIFNLVVLIVINATQLSHDDDSMSLSQITIAFGVFCLFGSLMIILFYPETNFKTKYQIEELIKKGKENVSFKNTTLLTGL